MFIIPIVVVALAIVFTIFLVWLGYPFLLRYFIENSLDTSSLANLTNGNNGANGGNGDNSPPKRDGATGPPGLSTAAGAAGGEGRVGGAGLDGPPGVDGPPGEDGEDGDTGVPGIDPIFIREDIFNPNSKRVFYVNGVPINTHIKSVEAKKDSAFQKDVERIKERIKTSFKKESNKAYFTTLANSLTRGIVPDPDPNVLDTLAKFNTFLDNLNMVYKTARNTLATIKSDQTTIINVAQDTLNSLRTQRNIDDNARQLQPFVDAIRDEKLNSVLTPPSSFAALRPDIIANIITIDQAISTLISERTTALNLAESTTIPAVRDAQSLIVQEKTASINLFKAVKEDIIHEKEFMKNEIFNAYKNGDDLSGNVYYGTLTIFGNYSIGGGSIALQSAIANARTAIDTAVVDCDTALNTFVDPIKTLNPLPP